MTDSSDVLDALGEPNRRALLEVLHRHHEATVSQLVDASGMRQPQVSKHLKVLASAQLVAVRTSGRHRHYRLDGRGLQSAHDWFASFDDVWQARFDVLDELVSTEEPRPRRHDHVQRPSSRRSVDARRPPRLDRHRLE